MHKINYTKIFVPTVQRKLLRIFLTIAAILKMILIQINVVKTYLESAFGQNKYSIFMKIPQRYLVDWKGLVCKILKSLYSLKQARKLWNKMITKFFKKIGFISTNTNIYIFII